MMVFLDLVRVISGLLQLYIFLAIFLRASGYAKMLNFKSNVFSLTVFVLSGQVNIAFGLLMAVGSFFGSIAGSRSMVI